MECAYSIASLGPPGSIYSLCMQMDGPQVKDQSFEHPHNLKLRVCPQHRSSFFFVTRTLLLSFPVAPVSVHHVPRLAPHVSSLRISLANETCRSPMKPADLFALSAPSARDTDTMGCIVSQRFVFLSMPTHLLSGISCRTAF